MKFVYFNPDLEADVSLVFGCEVSILLGKALFLLEPLFFKYLLDSLPLLFVSIYGEFVERVLGSVSSPEECDQYAYHH